MNETVSRNEELVRHVIALQSSDPQALLDSLDELIDPEVVWTPIIVGGLEPGSYHGHDGIRRYQADRGEAFGQGRVELLDSEEVAPDVLVVRLSDFGVGRSSGVSLTQEVWGTIRLRDGRILSWQSFRSRDEAMEAAGA